MRNNSSSHQRAAGCHLPRTMSERSGLVSSSSTLEGFLLHEEVPENCSTCRNKDTKERIMYANHMITTVVMVLTHPVKWNCHYNFAFCFFFLAILRLIKGPWAMKNIFTKNPSNKWELDSPVCVESEFTTLLRYKCISVKSAFIPTLQFTNSVCHKGQIGFRALEQFVKFPSHTNTSLGHEKELTVNQRGRNPRTEGSAAKTIQVKARATLCLTCKDNLKV